MLTLLLLFAAVILASALCSMSEAAILSLPMVRARLLVEKKTPNAKDVLYLKDHIRLTISTIVILNNAINIAGSIFIGQAVAVRFGDNWLGLTSTVMTFAIIIAAEIIPKTFGEHHKVGVSLFIAKFWKWLVILMRPLLWLIFHITKPFVEAHSPTKITEEEIKIMLKLGRDAGTVEMDEERLCNRVFRLNDLRAFQIMKPIDQIFALPADNTLGELRETIINSRYSRIAVYDKDPGDFVGMVQHRILLREIAKDNYSATVREFMTQPVFINWFMKADELLERFQMYNQHLFFVQDTHGKDVGLVTMEDVLEELFGEIYDEKDVKRPLSPRDLEQAAEHYRLKPPENKENRSFEI